MALRKILQISTDEEALRKVSRPIHEFNDKLVMLLEDLHETLRHADGLGLAAPQVGILKRVALAVDPETDKVYELINPKVVSFEGEETVDEGCLSIPGKYKSTTRPHKVTVSSMKRNGDQTEYTGTGYLARAFLHEMDHLDGVLFLDRS